MTVGDYRGVINGYLLEEFGDRPLESITADDIEGYRDKLLAEGRLSRRTVVRHLTVLHGVFKRAKRAYGLKDNPVLRSWWSARGWSTRASSTPMTGRS